MSRLFFTHCHGLLLSLGLAMACISPSQAESRRGTLLVGVTVLPACSLSVCTPTPTALPSSAVDVRCPRGVVYALTPGAAHTPSPPPPPQLNTDTITIVF